MILMLNLHPFATELGRDFCQSGLSSVLILIRILLSSTYLSLFCSNLSALLLPCVLKLFFLVFTCLVIPGLIYLGYLHINCTKYIPNHTSWSCTLTQLVYSLEYSHQSIKSIIWGLILCLNLDFFHLSVSDFIGTIFLAPYTYTMDASWFTRTISNNLIIDWFYP